MYNKNLHGGYLVYTDEAFEGRYIEIDTAGVVPFMTYAKASSNELFNSLIDFSAEEVSVGYLRYNYILQSLALSTKIICYVQSTTTSPLPSIVSVFRNANWLEREC